MIVGPASAFPFVAAPSSSHVGCEPPAHSRASSRTSSPRSSGGPHTSGVVASAKVIPAAYAGLGLALLSRAGGAGAWSGGPLIAQGGARFNRSTRVAQPPLATIDNSRYTLAQSVPRAPHCTDTLVIKTHYTRPRTVPTHSLTRHTLPVAREQIPLTGNRGASLACIFCRIGTPDRWPPSCVHSARCELSRAENFAACGARYAVRSRSRVTP